MTNVMHLMGAVYVEPFVHMAQQRLTHNACTAPHMLWCCAACITASLVPMTELSELTEDTPACTSIVGKSGNSLHGLLFKLTPKGVAFSFFLFFLHPPLGHVTQTMLLALLLYPAYSINQLHFLSLGLNSGVNRQQLEN